MLRRSKRVSRRPNRCIDELEGHHVEDYGLATQVNEEPHTVEGALNGPPALEWKQALKEEYDSLMENKTRELV